MNKNKIGGNRNRRKTLEQNIMDKHLKNPDNGYCDIFNKTFKLTIFKKCLDNNI